MLSNTQEQVLKRIRDIPSLPEVVNRIVQLMGKSDTPASEIARLISYDPGLTSKILRMVNSAAYGFQRQISSIQHAIMILGFNTVRGLVLSASIFKMFEGQSQGAGLNHHQFWEHSLTTAVAARLAGNYMRMTGVEDAFSAGMLHDIGKIVLDTYFVKDYQSVLRAAEKFEMPCHGNPFLSLEEEMIQTSHPVIGGFLAQKWKLPLPLMEAIQYHHKPEQAQHCMPLVYLIALGNDLALTYCRQPKKNSYPDQFQSLSQCFNPSVIEYFDLEEESLQALLDQLGKELVSIGELMSDVTGMK